MNIKTTISGIVILHVFAVLVLTTFGTGCRATASAPNPRGENLKAYRGIPGDGYIASNSEAARIAPVARPVDGSAPAAHPVEKPTHAPSPITEEVTAEKPAPAPVPVEKSVKPVSTASASKPVGAGHVYVVKKNDFLSGIAMREGVTVSELCAANGIKSNAMIKEGQKLTIPARSTKPVNTVGASAGKAAVAGSGEVYVVKSGESLSVIAKKLGTTSAQLRAENGLKGDAIREGQKLRIPAGGKAPAHAAKPEGKTGAAKEAVKPEAKSVKTEGGKAPAAAPVESAGKLNLFGGNAPAPAPVSAPAPAPVSATPDAGDAVK